MYVTYDLEQRTRGAKTAVYPKVKRVHIAGEVRDWKAGDCQKKTGRHVHGVRIEYEQHRRGYRRTGFDAQRGRTVYPVEPASVSPTLAASVAMLQVNLLLPMTGRLPNSFVMNYLMRMMPPR